jgi:magnesium transporter
MVKIHELHLQDLQNPLHPSTFEEYQDYRILVLRLPEQMSKKSKIHSYGFIMTEESVYYYDKKQKDFTQFPAALNDMYHFLDDKIDTLMHDIEIVQDKIVSLEESLYKKFTAPFMDHWYNLKKELSRSERVILKAVDILKLFIVKSKGSEVFPLNEFNDLHEHLERTLRSNVAANDQLDNLYQLLYLKSERSHEPKYLPFNGYLRDLFTLKSCRRLFWDEYRRITFSEVPARNKLRICQYDHFCRIADNRSSLEN